MKVRELLAALAAADENMEIVIRGQSTDESQFMGGVTHAGPECGCTETFVFMIDADEEAESDLCEKCSNDAEHCDCDEPLGLS